MSEGEFGEPPDWYVLLRAAKYLGVAPWDLADRPVFWLHWAVMAEAVEAEVQEYRMKKKRHG